MDDFCIEYDPRSGVSYPVRPTAAKDYGSYCRAPEDFVQSHNRYNYSRSNDYDNCLQSNFDRGYRCSDDLALVARNARSLSVAQVNRPASAFTSRTLGGSYGEPLYPASLLALDRQTKERLGQLRGRILAESCRKSLVDSNRGDCQMLRTHNSVSDSLLDLNESENKLSVFLPSKDVLKSGWRNSPQDYDNESVSSYGEVTGAGNFCYLCSTLDEHQRHRLQQNRRPKTHRVSKPRVKYVAPPPKIKKKDKDDVREEEAENILYKVRVKTGKQKDAGTSANVFIQLKGTHGLSRKKPLTRRHAIRFAFGVDTSEVFYVKFSDIGIPEALLVEHDGQERQHGWFLEKIELTNIASKDHYVFLCDQWLSLHVGERELRKILKPSSFGRTPVGTTTDFEVHVTTGTVAMAGTNANVFVTFYGHKRTSERMQLKGKQQGSKGFQKGGKDVFKLSLKDPGPLTAIRIEHDNTGTAPGWFLEEVLVLDRSKGKQYRFHCGQWLALDEGDGKLSRTLKVVGGRDGRDTPSEIEYKVEVVTGDVMSAGTDANVFVTFCGEKGRTSARTPLQKKKANNFERGSRDLFRISAADVGTIAKLKIEHDNSGVAPGWFLDKVMVTNTATKRMQTFHCGQWLAKDEGDGSLSRTLIPTDAVSKDSKSSLDERNKLKVYEVRVSTGDRLNAGTDANVFLTLCGLFGTTSKTRLRNNKSKKKSFERGATDVFEIEAEDVGEMSSVRIEHDNSGVGPGWFLDKLVVLDRKSGKIYEFPCGRWLATDEDDKKISRKLHCTDPETPLEKSTNRSQMMFRSFNAEI